MKILKPILYFLAGIIVTVAGVFLLKETVSAPTETTRESETTASSSSTSSPTTTTQKPSTTEPSAGSQGILDHDTYISFSDDDTSFPVGTLVTKSASVPDLLICETDSSVCKKGEFLIYFVDPLNETNSMEGVSVVRSTDGGKTWSDREPISIEGKINKGPAVDPSVVQLSDGSVRMYYYGPDKPFGTAPVTQDELRHVYSATSNDGTTFVADEGVRFSTENLTDPEVILFGTQWLMYYSLGQSSGVAVSDDGLAFEDKGEISLATGGVPGALVVDGGVRLYGCRMGIVSAFSENGVSFSNLTTSILPPVQGGVCDPSVAIFENEYVLVYKMAPAKTKVPTTP